MPTPAPTTPAVKTKPRTPAGIVAAFLVGAGLGGSGYVPHLIVDGEAPESGADCIVVGPVLDGKRICTPEAAGWGHPMEVVQVAGSGTQEALDGGSLVDGG